MSTATHSLIDHLALPADSRGYLWHHQAYALIPASTFEVINRLEGPHGKLALLLKPVLDGGYSFDVLAHPTFEKAAGIGIIHPAAVGSAPDVLLNYGALWSFQEYGMLGGCANVVANFESAADILPESPYEAVREETDTMTMGFPSDAFLPPYLRQQITDELTLVVPNIITDFNIVTYHRYVMGDRIAVTAQGKDAATAPEIQARLDWYAPPYLPFTLAG